MSGVPFWPALYLLWAGGAIGFSLAVAGPTPESITRGLVVAFLFAQWLVWPRARRWVRTGSPRARFIALGTVLAVAVEGFHMISKPVFGALVVTGETPVSLALWNYAVDLMFTVPAYLVIFAVIWMWISRHRFPFWHYVLVFGLAQTLGDGGLAYFFGAPGMLVFLPYPMTNYHAINVLPFLLVRDELPAERRPAPSIRSYAAIPVVIGVYFALGVVIRLVGQAFGLR